MASSQRLGPPTPKPNGPIAIISGTGEATDFKFGQNIHRVHPNKSPLKILEKRERGHIQGLPKFFRYSQLSQERVKLRTSNLVGTFTGSIRTKSPLQILEKREHGRIQRLPKFWGYNRLSRERVKLWTSNFVRTFIRSIGTKCVKNFGKSSRGRSQGLPKIFRAPTYRAHRVVVFAIAQLSCFTKYPKTNYTSCTKWMKWVAASHRNMERFLLCFERILRISPMFSQ